MEYDLVRLVPLRGRWHGLELLALLGGVGINHVAFFLKLVRVNDESDRRGC